LQAAMKSAQAVRERVSRLAIEEPDYRHRRLRARGNRPCGYSAAEKCDDVPPPHGAYPKAKDHGSTIAGQGRTSQQKPPARRASASGRLMRGGGPGAARRLVRSSERATVPFAGRRDLEAETLVRVSFLHG